MPRLILLAAASLALGAAGLVNAVDDANLNVERIAGDGWTAEQIAIDWDLPDRASATIGKLRLAAVSQELHDVRVVCPRLELSVRAIACERARVAANWPGIGAQSFTARLVYGRGDGSLDVDANGLRLGDGTIDLSAALRGGAWRAKTRMQRVPVELLAKAAKSLKLPLPPIEATGQVTLTADGRGAGTDLHASTFDASFTELTLNNEAGSIASDKLSARVQGAVSRSRGDWQFDIALHSAQGQAYVQPIFVDFGAHALRVNATGKLRGTRQLTIERFDLDHAQVAQASGQAALDFANEQPLRSLRLQLAGIEFPGAYESYLQPLLLDTNFKSMKTAGKLAGELTIEEGAPRHVDLVLEDLTLDDGARKFAIEALAGTVHWRADGQANEAPSALSWRSGAIFGMALGAADLQFSVGGRQFRLLQPTRIPLLDGALALESFRVRNAGLPSVAFMVDATLEPIDVKRVCQAFGWPEFGGRVGGTFSKLRMRDGVITLGTTLRAQVFDGSVMLSDLQLQQPFGQWPRFYSNVAFDNLDLELMTGAFSFGRITGRLSGRIDGLRLFNWSPVAFDAKLYTPPDDRSRHRISQRAVENIGSIGGGGAGVTAALSSGFLRFFDDFNYERLGLSCRLENDVCAMDGVAPAPNGGYYLVKGKGLPRIDVIGSSRRVDWPRLVQQLIAATHGGGPVVR
ncbi:MAG TPA: hypothetical protein VJT10_07670 [Steroidobacteraceae bacterium]|nr:hypothetical protein [Steroidobacteraceae bacterium]